jgi:hypothetical protein
LQKQKNPLDFNRYGKPWRQEGRIGEERVMKDEIIQRWMKGERKAGRVYLQMILR